ncbi:MAG: hypothetical protein IKH30_02220 [Clostridia bacterium]|nr:hypothetical protein [Clostridia bacterium]
MKSRLGRLIPVFALVMALVYPAALGVSRLAGWTYTLRSTLLYVLLCLSLVTAALFFSGEGNGANRAAALLVFPCSCVCGIFLHIGLESEWVSHCVLALVLVSIVLFGKTKMTWKIKLPIGILSLFPLLPILLLCLLSFIPLATKTERVSLSPNGAYMATLLVVDEGALGGNTMIWVYPTATVKHGILGDWTQEQEIYRGPWMEEDTLSFSWTDERTVCLNGDFIQIP